MGFGEIVLHNILTYAPSARMNFSNDPCHFGEKNSGKDDILRHLESVGSAQLGTATQTTTTTTTKTIGFRETDYK
jgi:hypothetical protein